MRVFSRGPRRCGGEEAPTPCNCLTAASATSCVSPCTPGGGLCAGGENAVSNQERAGEITDIDSETESTHKGHQCQEGVRTWPGDYARRRAGLTILLDPSSQLPGSSRRAARGQAGAPAAAQRRGRTSLTPASGGRSSGAGKGSVAVGLSGSCAGSRCVAGGVVSQAPIRRRASVRAAAMTMCPGPGCSVR